MTTGSVFMQPLIKYSIRTVVSPLSSSDRRVKSKSCSMTREILLMPFCAQAPPVAVEDSPGEYRLQATTVLRQHVWGKSIGQLDASAPEPVALNLATAGVRSTSCATLSLAYQLPYGAKSTVKPRDWRVSIELNLIAFTFYSSSLLETAPSVRDIKTMRSVRLDSSSVFSEKRSLTNAPWHLYKPLVNSARPTSPLSLWIAKIDIPIKTPQDLIPTFLSPLAARRYALRMRIHICGLRHVPLELQLPLQITHESLSDSSSMTSSYASRSTSRTSSYLESVLSEDGDAQVSKAEVEIVCGSILMRK